MNKREKSSRELLDFPYRKKFKCGECGCAITIDRKPEKNKVYYRCTKKKNQCSQKYIEQVDLDNQILRLLKRAVETHGVSVVVDKLIQHSDTLKSILNDIRDIKEHLCKTDHDINATILLMVDYKGSSVEENFRGLLSLCRKTKDAYIEEISNLIDKKDDYISEQSKLLSDIFAKGEISEWYNQLCNEEKDCMIDIFEDIVLQDGSLIITE